MAFDNVVVWNAIKDMKMEELSQWTPDEAGFLKKEPLSTMTCQQARQRFGVAPVMLSCWLCLAAVPDEEIRRQALKIDESEFWQPVSHYYKNEKHNEDSFPPGIHIVMEQALPD